MNSALRLFCHVAHAQARTRRFSAKMLYMLRFFLLRLPALPLDSYILPSSFSFFIFEVVIHVSFFAIFL